MVSKREFVGQEPILNTVVFTWFVHQTFSFYCKFALDDFYSYAARVSVIRKKSRKI